MASLKSLSRWKCDRGAELIEFALVLPLLLLVVMGIVDFGLLFRDYEVVTNAAREGARIAVLPDYEIDPITDRTTSDVAARVYEYLEGAGLTATPTLTKIEETPEITEDTCIQLVGVAVSYPHTYTYIGGLMGFFGTSFTSTTMTARASMRAESGTVECP